MILPATMISSPHYELDASPSESQSIVDILPRRFLGIYRPAAYRSAHVAKL